MIDFSGKTVLVTGGGAGIGRATAEAFGKAGASVVVAEIDAARVAETSAAFNAAGVDSLVVLCDVTSRSAVQSLANDVKVRFGKLDVLVNNVGHFVHAKPFEALADDEIDAIIAINIGQVFSVTRAMLPLLRAAAPESSIVNITSIEAYRGIPNCSIYAACKAAIAGWTKSLALELAPAGIRINDVAPETTDTAQVPIDLKIPQEHTHNIERWIPLGRFGRPEDCAGAALYLASPLASWVTGTAVHVDGGALAAAGWTRDPKGVWTVMPVVTGNGMNL